MAEGANQFLLVDSTDFVPSPGPDPSPVSVDRERRINRRLKNLVAKLVDDRRHGLACRADLQGVNAGGLPDCSHGLEAGEAEDLPDQSGAVTVDEEADGLVRIAGLEQMKAHQAHVVGRDRPSILVCQMSLFDLETHAFPGVQDVPSTWMLEKRADKDPAARQC